MPAGSTRGGVAPLITTAASLQAPLPPPAQLPTLHIRTLDPGSPLAPPLRSGAYHRWCRRVWRRRRRRRWWSWWPPIGPRLAERKGAGEVSSLLSGHRERGVEEVVESAGGDRSAQPPQSDHPPLPNQHCASCMRQPPHVATGGCRRRRPVDPCGHAMHAGCLQPACSCHTSALCPPRQRSKPIPYRGLKMGWSGMLLEGWEGKLPETSPPHRLPRPRPHLAVCRGHGCS